MSGAAEWKWGRELFFVLNLKLSEDDGDWDVEICLLADDWKWTG